MVSRAAILNDLNAFNILTSFMSYLFDAFVVHLTDFCLWCLFWLYISYHFAWCSYNVLYVFVYCCSKYFYTMVAFFSRIKSFFTVEEDFGWFLKFVPGEEDVADVMCMLVIFPLTLSLPFFIFVFFIHNSKTFFCVSLFALSFLSWLDGAIIG